jgi:transglutaminase-like putative cysteine protease
VLRNADDLLTLLTPDARRALLARAERRVYQPGDVLIEQEKTSHSLFRIHSGFATVKREHEGSTVELSRMEPGTWFGEMSLLENAPASATVIADSRIELDELSETSLQDFLAAEPRVAADFYRSLSIMLSRRLRNLDAAILERLLDGSSRDRTLVDEAKRRDYLTATEFCDLHHPEIRALARKLAEGASDSAELARRVFYWVRDEVLYTFGLSNSRASETLATRRGSCSHKANLFVALTRSMGIPSGFQLMSVRTREYLGPANTRRFAQFMSHSSLHVFPAVAIGDRWLPIDPSDDRRLSDGIGHLNPPSQLVNFDGHGAAMLNLSPQSIEYYDATCWPSIDEVLGKARRIDSAVLVVSNRYVDFMRDFGPRYSDVERFSADFFEWLRAHHPDEHREFERREGLLAAQQSPGSPPSAG